MDTFDQKSRRILIVDDNVYIHNDFKKILNHSSDEYQSIDDLALEYFEKKVEINEREKEHTYRIDVAFQGRESIHMVKQAIAADDPYMLAFVDMRIPPGINGLETIKEMFQYDSFIQVVLCTAYSDYSYEDIKREIGSTPNFLILKKPFDACEVEQMASALTEKWILVKKRVQRVEELNQMVDQRTAKLSQLNQELEKNLRERKRAEYSIKILTQQNLRIQEKERQRIARDLHDSVAQDLAALLIKQEVIFDNLNLGENDEAITQIRKSIEVLRTTIENVRSISYNLRPPTLNEFGIVISMRRLCETFYEDNGIHVAFYPSGMGEMRFDDTTEINLYRICQEALNNIKHHADSKNVTVGLTASPDHVTLSIKDDGRGFNTDKRLYHAIKEKRMGLKGIEERVNLIQGEFHIHSIPYKGTEILVRIPNCAASGFNRLATSMMAEQEKL